MKRCLIVDDNPTNIGLGMARIEEIGLSTSMAYDLVEAKRICDARNIDVILLDLHIGDETSLEFAKTLRNTEKGKDIKIILYSAVEGAECRKIVADCSECLDTYIDKLSTVKEIEQVFEQVGIL